MRLQVPNPEGAIPALPAGDGRPGLVLPKPTALPESEAHKTLQ
jgi:hypothetical protein